ncbi:ABC transporter ATP-binding protein [Nakamurella deserti]|uniref:ABC transporter ATP-binding protein n=1 Tax=Nakamurella deserti TaxID=2164074 RepID=UPI000DBE8322|nr:ABC transporter ATP-binding protein [Nakamurella deserti]
MGTLLSVSRLTVTAGIELVHGVDLELAAGERVGIIGASGSGKTLTCLAVAGLLPPELRVAGSIRLDGVDHDLVDAGERRLAKLRGSRVGMVFQEPMTALNPTMRIGRQVAEVMRLHTPVGRREAAAATLTLLDATGLPDPARIARSYPHQLSGGQRQRIMLAIALANSPDLLICDEPTTALDVTVQATVLALIDRRVREENAALLFISHNLAVVAEVCDRVLVMFEGRIVEAGTVEQVLTDPQHPHTRSLLADAELSAT